MSRKSRMADLRQAKDRRAKRLAIGGVVVLAAVLAFEVPKVMKSGGGNSSSPPAATTTATAGAASTTPGTTAPGSAAAAAAPTVSAKLTTSDVAPRRSKSQLYSFSHFAGKDPFIQQVTASSITSSPAGSSGSPSGTSGKTSGGSSSAGGRSSSYTAPAQQTSNRTLAQSGAAVIQVNGKMQTVRVGASFPSSNPLFTLVSVSHGVARIGIANGSYASGAQTVSLAPGRSLTLVDTADNVRYKLGLVSAS
jgi:hypothetical protein